MAVPEIASGAEWRKDRVEGFPVRLPNGRWISLRPITFDLFVKLADIPDYMTPVVEKMMRREGIRKPEDIQDEVKKKGVLLLLREDRTLREVFAKISMVKPRVVDEPTAEDEISVDDLDAESLELIMGFFASPVDELRTFSRKQMELVESVPSEPIDQPTTIEDDGIEEVAQEELPE